MLLPPLTPDAPSPAGAVLMLNGYVSTLAYAGRLHGGETQARTVASGMLFFVNQRYSCTCPGRCKHSTIDGTSDSKNDKIKCLFGHRRPANSSWVRAGRRRRARLRMCRAATRSGRSQSFGGAPNAVHQIVFSSHPLTLENAATECLPLSARYYGHFAYLAKNVEEMFVTGRPPYPVERVSREHTSPTAMFRGGQNLATMTLASANSCSNYSCSCALADAPGLRRARGRPGQPLRRARQRQCDRPRRPRRLTVDARGRPAAWGPVRDPL